VLGRIHPTFNREDGFFVPPVYPSDFIENQIADELTPPNSLDVVGGEDNSVNNETVDVVAS